MGSLRISHALVVVVPLLLGARPVPGPCSCATLCTEIAYDEARQRAGRAVVACPTLKGDKLLVCDVENKDGDELYVKFKVDVTCAGQTQVARLAVLHAVPGKSKNQVELDLRDPCPSLDRAEVRDLRAGWADD